MNPQYKDLIYLLYCAVNGTIPDTAKVQAMDLQVLYKIAKFHTVRAAVCIALKRAGVQDKQFDQAYKKAVRKNICLDIERSAILADFEQKRRALAVKVFSSETLLELTKSEQEMLMSYLTAGTYGTIENSIEKN